MKVSIDPIDGGTITLSKLYNSALLVTDEGNSIAVCMRDDTICIKVLGEKGENPKDGVWHTVGMRNKSITSDTLTGPQSDSIRYRYLRDESNWGEDSGDEWGHLGELTGREFDSFIDDRMALERKDPCEGLK